MRENLLLVVSLLALSLAPALAACGGAIEPVAETSEPPPAALSSASVDAPPYGTWDLVTLERETGAPATVYSVLELDLRPDGTVVARRCGKLRYEPGSVTMRCADQSSYDCFYGTIAREGDAFRVRLPDLFDPTIRDQGIVERVGGHIEIRRVVPAYPRGRFAPVPEDQKGADYATSTVGNCSGS